MSSIANPEYRASLASPPAWFRYGVIAAATLIMCSCRIADPLLIEAQPNRPAPVQASNIPSNEQIGDGLQNSEPNALALGGFKKTSNHESPLASASGSLNVLRTSDVAFASHESPIARQTTSDPKVVNALHEVELGSAKEIGQLSTASEETIDPQVTAAQCLTCPPPASAACVCQPEACGIGPADEYLCDGGDFGTPVGVRANWQIDGLEQEDTIAHYDTIDGRTIVTPSNRVCIYAPRFGVVRKVIDLREYARYEAPGGYDSNLALSQINENERAIASLNQRGPVINRGERPPSLLMERLMPGELALDVEVREFDGSLSAYADLQIVRAGLIEMEEKALVQEAVEAAITWTGDQTAQVTFDKRTAQAEVGVQHLGVIYHQDKPNNPKLRLIKLASKCAAQPGDEVEFLLRYDNIGDRVIGNVTITDNLTTRLEYIPESAQASVDADFSTQPNDHGSVIIRWEITDPVEPGEGGILRFKCKVR